MVAQQTDSIRNRALKFDYGSTKEVFTAIYLQNPSMFAYNHFNNWSYIGASLLNEEGDYRDTQKHNELKQWGITTESILNMDKSGWKLYGLFNYANGSADSVRYNLNFHLPQNGSPNYVFMQKAGEWNYQKYQLSTMAAKAFGNYSVGLRINYLGDLAFRQNDTRNNQTTLRINVGASAGYRFNNKHSIALGGEYKRDKTEPQFSKKYQHPNQGASNRLYNIYINGGMGTYHKDDNIPRLTQSTRQGAVSVQWLFSSDRNHYSALLKLGTGNDFIKDKEITENQKENRLLSYDFDKIKANIFTINNKGKYTLQNNLTFEAIDGKGKSLNANNQQYTANYETMMTTLHFASTAINNQSVLRKLGLLLHLDDQKRIDRSYGFKMNYQNLKTGAVIGFAHHIQSSQVWLDLGFNYQKNMNYAFDEGGAMQNIYTEWIAKPAIAYLTADSYSVPVSLNLKIPLETVWLEFNFNAEYFKPIDIKSPNTAMFTKNDSFMQLKSLMRVYF